MKIIRVMKKLIPYLLFFAATLNATFGVSPVMAMGCSSHSDKVEVICEESDNECQEKFSASKLN